MLNRRYVFWYGVLAAIALIAGITPMALSGNAGAGPILIALLASLAIAPALIWLAERMGYPLARPVSCPRCGTEMPLLRKPTTVRQGLWGGYTCPKCGTQMDAAGKELN